MTKKRIAELEALGERYLAGEIDCFGRPKKRRDAAAVSIEGWQIKRPDGTRESLTLLDDWYFWAWRQGRGAA